MLAWSYAQPVALQSAVLSSLPPVGFQIKERANTSTCRKIVRMETSMSLSLEHLLLLFSLSFSPFALSLRFLSCYGRAYYAILRWRSVPTALESSERKPFLKGAHPANVDFDWPFDLLCSRDFSQFRRRQRERTLKRLFLQKDFCSDLRSYKRVRRNKNNFIVSRF